MTPSIGQPFFVIQLFDREGYYGCVFGMDLDQVVAHAEARTRSAKQLVACSVPFPGRWTPSGLPDVSLPDEMRTQEALGPLEHSERKDD